MSNMAAPLTPANCDLRAYDWFPFFHKRLRQSSFWKRASDLACRISVDLWAEAYEQVPAASVPDDDHLLAEWAGFGRRDLSGWLAIKDEVMSAWIRCSDGRWYHPTLSEVACEAFVKQRMHAWSRECDRLRKENARREKAGEPALKMPPKPSDDPFDDVRSEGNEQLSGGTTSNSEGSQSDEAPVPAENALRGTGTRTDRLSSSLRSEETRANALPPEASGRPKQAAAKSQRKHPYPPGAFSRWYEIYPHKVGRGAAEKAFAKVVASDSVEFATLTESTKRYILTKPPDHAWCNPATWLNQRRWEDRPATSLTAALSQDGEPSIDLGEGNSAKPSTIRNLWRRKRWPPDWGPSPDTPGCRIPAATMARIMEEAA